MSDLVDALKELAEKMQSGSATYVDFHANYQLLQGFHGRAHEAYVEESLNGAQAVHGALLPGWDYVITRDIVDVWQTNSSGMLCELSLTQGKADNPARAWLLAIIQAKIAICQ